VVVSHLGAPNLFKEEYSFIIYSENLAKRYANSQHHAHPVYVSQTAVLTHTKNHFFQQAGDCIRCVKSFALWGKRKPKF